MSLSFDARMLREDFEVQATLEAGPGRTIALLGPNGSGKSTIVGAIAGLEPIMEGTTVLDDRVLDDTAAGVHVPARDRQIGVVFQDLLLFPHLSGLENAAFPLRARGVGRREARERAMDLLERLGLPTNRSAARPGDLSGGEAQRVALARALIHEPSLLLLDEPTTSLDVLGRAEIRRLLGGTLGDLEAVKLLVTHDPVEAMTLGDHLVVVEEGRVTQVGSAEEMRRSPQTHYVAEIVGLNLFSGRLERIEPGAGRIVTERGDIVVASPPGSTGAVDRVVATLRPADVALHTERPEGGSARNVLHGPLTSISIEGERARVGVGSAPPVVAEVTLGSIDRLGLVAGKEVWVSFKAVEVDVRLPAGTLGE